MFSQTKAAGTERNQLSTVITTPIPTRSESTNAKATSCGIACFFSCIIYVVRSSVRKAFSEAWPRKDVAEAAGADGLTSPGSIFSR